MEQELKSILERLNSINDQIRRESIVYNAELSDRLKKGLTGADAIKHYNDWMIKFNMSYLCVK